MRQNPELSRKFADLDAQEKSIRQERRKLNMQAAAENQATLRAAKRARMTDEEKKKDAETDVLFSNVFFGENGRSVLDILKAEVPIAYAAIMERIDRARGNPIS